MSTNSRPRETVAVSIVCLFLVGFGGSTLLVALPAVGAEFNADTAGLARLGATLALGAGVALPLSVVADRWRRGPMAAMGVAGFSVAALASAAAPSLALLATARFGAVCLEALVAAVATAVAVEVVPPARRGLTLALLALGSGAGAAVTVLTYPLLVPHWRWLYLAAAGLGLLLSPLALRLPGRPAGDHPEVSVLLRAPWRGRLVLLAAAAALGGILYEPANFFAVLFGSRRLGFSATDLSAILGASGVAAAVGYAAGGAASDRAGRRIPAVGLLILSILLAAASYTPLPAIYVGAGIAWSGLAGAATPMVGAWTAELVPTRARVTAYTAVGMAGAVGGVLGLQLVGATSGPMGLPAAIWLTAVPALLGSALLLALPETKGLALPD